MSEFRNIQGWDLEGPRGSLVKVKPGDKICFINPKVLTGIQAENTDSMIRIHGDGPFLLLEIRVYPSAKVLFHFVDGQGKEVDACPDYFTKYEDETKKEEMNIIERYGKRLFQFFREEQRNHGHHGCVCGVCESDMINALERLSKEMLLVLKQSPQPKQ